MGLILAIETSLAPGSVALGDEAGVRLRLAPEGAPDFARWLGPAMQRALAAARRDEQPLAAVAVALGPGSFTGLRVGLATAKGLCMANRLPLIGVPTAELIAAETPLSQAPLLVVVPFNARELYATRYEPDGGRWRLLEETRLVVFAELLGRISSPAVVAGPLLPEHAAQLSRVYGPGVLVYDRLRPDCATLCRIAFGKLTRGETLPPAETVPHYVSDPTPVRRAQGEAP